MILTVGTECPNTLILSNLDLNELEEVEAYQRRYGDREQFVRGSVVCRPDGTLFIQGDLSTYRTTVVPPDPQFVSWSGILFPGISPNARTGRPADGSPSAQSRSKMLGYSRGGRPGAQDAAVPHTPIPSRTVYRERWVERTYEVPGGEVTVRRLRRSTEGRGM